MKPTLHSIVIALTLIAAALIAEAWHEARRDAQQLAAALAAQNNTIQQAGDRERQRDSQLAAALAAIQAQKRSVHTPQQAASHLISVLPPLPLPVSIQALNLSTPTLPKETPAATISVPQPDLVPLYDDLQDCRASLAQNESLQRDLADEKSRSAALLQERNSALAAAHGGTFFLRLKRAAKWFAIGAAAGAAATAITHH